MEQGAVLSELFLANNDCQTDKANILMLHVWSDTRGLNIGIIQILHVSKWVAVFEAICVSKDNFIITSATQRIFVEDRRLHDAELSTCCTEPRQLGEHCDLYSVAGLLPIPP